MQGWAGCSVPEREVCLISGHTLVNFAQVSPHYSHSAYVLRETSGHRGKDRIELLGPEVGGERKHLGMFVDRDAAWAEVDALESGRLKKDEGA